MEAKRIEELVLQTLEHELGGIQVYETALLCAVQENLKTEWQEYLDQTQKHVSTLQGVCKLLGVNPERETAGRVIVRHLRKSLVEAMTLALSGPDPAVAELIASECVALAATKDHLGWELIGQYVEHLSRHRGAAEVSEVRLMAASGWSN